MKSWRGELGEETQPPAALSSQAKRRVGVTLGRGWSPGRRPWQEPCAHRGAGRARTCQPRRREMGCSGGSAPQCVSRTLALGLCGLLCLPGEPPAGKRAADPLMGAHSVPRAALGHGALPAPRWGGPGRPARGHTVWAARALGSEAGVSSSACDLTIFPCPLHPAPPPLRGSVPPQRGLGRCGSASQPAVCLLAKSGRSPSPLPLSLLAWL